MVCHEIFKILTRTVNIPTSENPSCLQATLVSDVPQKSSHTVPQMLLWHISTRPVMLLVPPLNLIPP